LAGRVANIFSEDAVRKYREYQYGSSTGRNPIALAEAAIAALEAENERLSGIIDRYSREATDHITELETEVKRLRGGLLLQADHRAVVAEDELAALKARRCATCGYANLGAMSGLPDHVWCRKISSAWRKESFCSEWTPREDG
jgi:hypothetical protein